MSATTPVPTVGEIPGVPTNAEHDIVFNFPWEAKAFALEMAQDGPAKHGQGTHRQAGIRA